MSGAKAHWIERQHTLKALQQVQKQKAEETEGEKASRIPRPMLLGGLVNATACVTQVLDRPEYRMKKRALPGKDSDHVGTQGLGNRDQHQKKTTI
jgi:hypothetical protein